MQNQPDFEKIQRRSGAQINQLIYRPFASPGVNIDIVTT